jgi:hypothetical protein
LMQQLLRTLPSALVPSHKLATMSPGVHADALAGTGSNTGLGNRNIYANGQRS